jgi:hypothetical protein
MASEGILLTYGQLCDWAGVTNLSDAQLDALDEAIPNSAIPDAIGTIVASLQVEGDEEDGDDAEDGQG